MNATDTDYSTRINRTLHYMEDFRRNQPRGGTEEIAATEKLDEDIQRHFPDTHYPPPTLPLLTVSFERPIKEETHGELRAYATGFVIFSPKKKPHHASLLPQVVVRQEDQFLFLSPRKETGPRIIQKRRASDIVPTHLLECEWLLGFNPGIGRYVFHDGFTRERWRQMEQWLNRYLPSECMYIQ